MSNQPQKNIRKLSFLSFNRNSEGNDSSNGGTQAGEVRLDDEMEKVFSMSGNVSEERFDVSRLHDTPESAPAGTPRLGEKDYSLHRKKSYPHIHVPLKALHSRSMRRRLTSPQIATTQSIDSPNSNPESPIGEADDITSRLSVSETYALSSTATAADYPDRDDDDDTGAFSSGSEAPISDPAVGSGSQNQSQPLLVDESPGSLAGSPDRRVQFTIGGIPKIPEDETQTDLHEEDETKKHRKNWPGIIGLLPFPRRKICRYHHHGHSSRFRKYSLQEDPGWRKRSGSEQRVTGSNGSRRVSIQPEDATLQEVDIDDLDSHRSDEPRVVRRHKTSKRGSVVHISRKDGGEKLLQNVLLPHAFKKMYDHSPHAIFVQLDELMGVGEDREWKETARWIKYEEDVEEGSDRWGRPHVASLSFHSLLNLRRCLETGVVLLDLEERDLPGVAYRVSEQMVIDELIQETDKPQIMRALLLRHRHVNEHERGFRFARRHNSSYASLQSLWADEASASVYGSQRNVGRCSICSAQGRSSICSAQNIRLNSPHLPKRNNLHNDEKRKTSFPLETIQKNGTSNCDAEGRLIVPAENHTIIDLKEETYTSSTEDLKKAHNDTILKRIPIGAEATTVLVGAVDFLEQPTIAFVRLAEGILLPSITEVTIPVRFLFILLGPITADLDYHEIGRSISTLMANHQFHKIAYKADDRKALLSAINEFLDDSIVLPPGDWEKQTLLPFDELKAKSDAIRKRKLKAIKEKGDTTDETAKALLAADGGDGKKPPRDDPLKRTRRPFGGLINDLKRRFPYYKSDITEGCNAQCAAAALFMYFAALSGAITFGGLMSDKTQNMIGISETLVATSVAGIVFALVAGQPLVIVGSTGPLLLFDESLFEFCKSNNLEYLTTRIYIGIWMGVIALMVACFEGSVFVKLFTRFTEEIFSALISLLYIVESVMKLFFVFGRHPLMASYCDSFIAGFTGTEATVNSTAMEENGTLYTDYDGMLMDEAIGNGTESTTFMMIFNKTEHQSMEPGPYIGPINQPNTALFCTILSLGTFAIAYYLRLFRNSKFLGRSARRALGDFGVPIAIVLMVALDYFVPETYTEKLKVPEGLSPSNPQVRGWLINPAGTDSPFPLWLAFACVIPAMLVYILVFMETHISELIIDKKERKLRKGSGFHLDIVLICLINVGCGFLGTPWICAATVRSVAHVSAVTVMSRTHAPGEKPHVVEVKEQRVSALTVATLVGISVLMSPLLRLVPMSVLFGVFLYMGISSMDGIQFFDRIKLFFMPVKHHPSVPYVRRVQTMKMHLFTFIQLMCLVVLWVVKSTKASLAFPFFLLLMVPLRAQMTHLFTPAELRALDGDQPDVDDDEPDFYVEATLPG